MLSITEKKLQKLVAELFIVRASGHFFDSQRKYPQWELTTHELKTLINLGIGGVIFFGGTIKEVEERCRLFKHWSSQPILLCADIEEGIGQRFDGGLNFVPPMAISQIFKKEPKKGIEFAEKYGFFLGDQARKVGLNWVLAPVCDVNTNPNNPVINLRAWGEDPLTVSNLISAFQRGISERGVLTCAKHFPGHGDSEVDSHLQLPVLQKDLSDLINSDLLPFQKAIKEGADCVMTAHLLFPKIDHEFPVTLSKYFLTNILRRQMNFDGLIVTDALVMKAISNLYGGEKAAVLAFEAGADLIMMPEKPYAAIQAIMMAILHEKIPLNRLYESINRKRNALKKLSKFEHNYINQSCFSNANVLGEFDSKKSIIFSEELIKSSIILKNKENFFFDEDSFNFVKLDKSNLVMSPDDSFPAIAIPKKLGLKSIILDSFKIQICKNELKKQLDLSIFSDKKVFLQIFSRGKPFKENDWGKEFWNDVIQKLQKSNRLIGVAIYGCPYLWANCLKILEPSIACCYSPGQMSSAQRELLEQLFPSFEQPIDRVIEPFTN